MLIGLHETQAIISQQWALLASLFPPYRESPTLQSTVHYPIP